MTTAAPTPQSRGSGLATFGTALHAGLVLALLVLCVRYVPAAKKTFDEFGMTLPLLTRTVIKLSTRIAAYWWALVPVFALLGVTDFVLMARLGRRGRVLPSACITVVALVLGLGIVVTLFAIQLPMAKLQEVLAN